VANLQLTLKQFAILTLGQSTPPWHLGNLLKSYNQYRISLRESVTALSGATAVIFAGTTSSANDFANMITSWCEGGGSSQTAYALWGYWFAASPGIVYHGNSPAVLLKLANILSPIGGSIVYADEYYTTVGIAATFGALASLNTAVIPDTPPSVFLTFSKASLYTAPVDGAVLLGPIYGQAGGTVVLSSTPYTPLPPAMAGSVPMGLLWIYLNNQQNNTAVVSDIDTQQLAAQHLQISRDSLVNFLSDTTCGQASVGILEALGDAIEDVTAYIAWLDHLTSVTVSNPLPAGTNLSLGFKGNFIIPQITLQPLDTSQPPITISEVTVEPDGTITGGTVSQ
jgi:hypothetical protein